ncbi:MAG: heparinase II/III family protein [Planctomycetota bacterium]|nr:heparinase II/III family protein [Planctomycetota bacterium]
MPMCFRLSAIMLVLIGTGSRLAFSAEAGESRQVLEGLLKEHPRLMLTDARLGELKGRYKQDALVQRYVKDLLDEADRLLDARPLRYEIPDGLRLLSVSRECLRRVSTQALAYRLTEDQRYARAALRDLRAVCAFQDWNPRHFLDTAEMTTAVALGYDWLYKTLDDDTRKTLHDAIIRLGLEPGRQAYEEKKYGFLRADNNWNQVCNLGMSVGALAVADTDPDLAAAILAGAVKSLPIAMKHYAPAGAWMEGPGYWNYATSYTCYGIAALDTALGKDLGISAYPGFSESGFFPIYGTGPTGRYLCYADAGMLSSRGPQACLFLLAGKFKRPEFSDSEHEILRGRRASAFHVIWYQPPSGQTWRRDLDRYFAGPVEVVVMRSAWDDPDALWIGAKAGFNQVPHGHLDLGNFELEALGVRWAIDLGADDYNMPGYWDAREGGKRWSYYRLNSQSHNVCTLDGKDQPAAGTSRIVRWHSDPDAGAAVVDLTKAYANVTRAARGVQLLRKERAILIQDEFTFPSPRDVVWGMTTAAEIRVQDDGSAMLTQNGKRLEARVLSPVGSRFKAASAEQAKPQAENRGMRRLLLSLDRATNEQRIAVLFVPMTADGQPVPQVPVVPLTAWPGESKP